MHQHFDHPVAFTDKKMFAIDEENSETNADNCSNNYKQHQNKALAKTQKVWKWNFPMIQLVCLLVGWSVIIS